MYHPDYYWFTKEGIDEYLKTKVQEYSFAFKTKEPLRLNIHWDNTDKRSEAYVNTKLKVAKLYNIEVTFNKENSYSPQMVQYPHSDFRSLVNFYGKYDVEGLNSYWKAIQCDNPKLALWPCTARGIFDHISWVSNKIQKNLEGSVAIIIGRSELVGRPIARMLEAFLNMTVIQCHSHTPESTLKQLLYEADVVVSAVGKPYIFRSDMFRYGALTYDVGINLLDGKIVGDITPSEKSYITPVPGGVGKLTVHALMHNTIDWYLNNLNG